MDMAPLAGQPEFSKVRSTVMRIEATRNIDDENEMQSAEPKKKQYPSAIDLTINHSAQF
jgi:hypothetical protein